MRRHAQVDTDAPPRAGRCTLLGQGEGDFYRPLSLTVSKKNRVGRGCVTAISATAISATAIRLLCGPVDGT